MTNSDDYKAVYREEAYSILQGENDSLRAELARTEAELNDWRTISNRVLHAEAALVRAESDVTEWQRLHDREQGEVGRLTKALALTKEERDIAVQSLKMARERMEKAESDLEAMKDRDYEPIKKWITEHAPEAVKLAWSVMVEAETERDEAVKSLKLLWKEVQDSGNATATNDGWPEAIRATKAVLKDL